MPSTQEIIEADERRARRDAYRAGGGSKRRALKTFYTAAEKKDRREQHRDLLAAAIAELEDLQGFGAWLEVLDLNPQLTACNAALVAFQTPGEIVGTSASWRKQGCPVRKGDHGAGRITAPGFWPLAYFTAEQVGCGDLADATALIELCPLEVAERLHAQLQAGLATGDKPRLVLDAVAETYRSGRVSLWGAA